MGTDMDAVGCFLGRKVGTLVKVFALGVDDGAFSKLDSIGDVVGGSFGVGASSFSLASLSLTDRSVTTTSTNFNKG